MVFFVLIFTFPFCSFWVSWYR